MSKKNTNPSRFTCRRAASALLAILMAAVTFSACGSAVREPAQTEDTLSIVVTIFPEYDWVENILGENAAQAEVTMLLDNGVDLHSFQPTAADIMKIASCDLFIYVGGESDEWVEDALKESANPDRMVIELLEVLGERAKEEKIVEGMESETDEEEGEDDEPEYDEHVWVSLRNAALFVDAISEALQSIDPDHGGDYRQNAEAYNQKLDVLDRGYRAAVDEAQTDTLLFGDRFPFRYLTDDYGLTYYAAFAGCSAETEASFETIAFLAEKVDELSLKAVLTLEGTDHRIAETIVRNTESRDQQVLALNSMQSVTMKEVNEGSTYLSIMERNLEILKEALK